MGFLKIDDNSPKNFETLGALRLNFRLFLVSNYNKFNALNCK